MANAYKDNVVRVDTSAAFPSVSRVKSIKYIGNTSGTANVRADASASGEVLWTESGTANAYNADVCIQCKKGVYVEVTNGAVVYLYLG